MRHFARCSRIRTCPQAIGDEGGFAPALSGNEEACALIVGAIKAAGFEPGRDIAIALDPAASSFHSGGAYRLGSDADSAVSSEVLADLYRDWVERFPIVSIEDGFDENDWSAFARQTTTIGKLVQVVGDDLYVTNPRFIERGIAARSTNAVLIKLNQIGTVTETVAAIELCRQAGWRWGGIASLGRDGGHVHRRFRGRDGRRARSRPGAPCRGERTAKYNRLLTIERELGAAATFASPFPRAR